MTPTISYQQPTARGYYGEFGGAFVPEMLFPNVEELRTQYEEILASASFRADYEQLLRDYVGRPTPLFEAKRLSAKYGTRIYLKREDLCHTGAHKINNTVGQILLAQRLGKTRIIAETGAGQHGVATATVCALMGLPCVVYMGSVDIERQASNVARMRLLGATVVPVTAGSRTLKDAINEALRDWVANVENTHYLLGTVAGPHPFPVMVRDFHRIIGEEARAQVLELTGALPDAVTACVGGGSNAMGIFHAFLDDPEVSLYGYEAAGDGHLTERHAATITRGRPGVLHGTRTYLLQDEDGQTAESHSISAGLDYPGVGPEHSWLNDIGRATYLPITDDEAMAAMRLLSMTEGIIPAIETAHALAGTIKLGLELGADATILVNLSGRGDKDMETAGKYFDILDTAALTAEAEVELAMRAGSARHNA